MTDSNPVLSIIMPCYNGAGTIRRALDSIFGQDFDYSYEIVIVDDGSTDGSYETVAEIARSHPQIIQYANEKNMGNAMTFYKALTYSRGKYFCVLDVDDYYSVRDKLQKQVDFLESDVEEDYVAVTHHYAIDLQDDNVHIPDMSNVTEFNYTDIINQRSGYYHTATYVYRNIFKGNVPELFKQGRFRGDTVRTVFHTMFSNRKVKVLNFVGSVYNWSMEGIWSSIGQKKQFDIQIGIWSGLKEICSSDMERASYDKLIHQCEIKQKSADDVQRTYPASTIDNVIRILCQYAGKYAFDNREFTFQGLYYSEYIDSLAATLGCIHRMNHPEQVIDAVRDNVMCIIVNTLKPKGGGIFRELQEFIELFSDWEVHLISTERAPSDSDIGDYLSQYNNLNVHILQPGFNNKLNELKGILKEISPSRIYLYDSHDDLYPFVAIQPGPCVNICLFSYDHGFVSGLSSPNLDRIIAKRPLDYEMLSRAFGRKVVYIPAWNVSNSGKDFQYKPFNGHDRLITACGAARFYKLQATYGPSYIDVVLSTLRRTSGQHYHYGPIPDEELERIRGFIQENGLRDDAFVHIPWADDPVQVLTSNHVDLFIEPFPLVSYKITMDVQMCGIPVISYAGLTRMSTVDFTYAGNMTWRSEAEFLGIVSSLDAKTLMFHSQKSKDYFKRFHSSEAVGRYYKNDIGAQVERGWHALDNYALEIMGIEKNFQNGHIRIATVINSGGNVFSNQNSTNWSKDYESDSGEGIVFGIRRTIHRINRFMHRKAGGSMLPKINQNEVRALYESKKEEDRERAFLICKSFRNKDPHAFIWLSRMYRNGIGVEKNLDKAVSNMELAVTSGIFTVRNELIDTLLERGEPGDACKAFIIAKGFAEEGDGPAIGRLAKMYKEGIGTEQDPEEASVWIFKAAEKNIKWAKRDCVDILLTRGDDESVKKAFVYARELADEGDSGSCGRLARMYRDGTGTSKNLDAAIQWMEEADSKGVRWAKRELADLLLERGTADDTQKAFELLKIVAGNGDPGSCGRLARMYRDGTGTSKNLDAAIQWMEEADSKGVRWAKRELADLLLERGTADDQKKAFDIIKEMAERGDSVYYVLLSRMYREGIGTRKNQSEAMRWEMVNSSTRSN